MAIIYQFPTPITGTTNLNPNFKFMVVGDNLSTVTAAGYLDQSSLQGYPLSTTDIIQMLYSYDPVAKTGTYSVFSVSISGTGVITLVEDISEGNVVLPTIANHIATYVDTTGKISEDAATAINGGNIQAGLSGTAGYLASFPGTGSRGSLRLAAINNTADYVVTISNAAHGQASTISIPDGGQSTSNFIISNSAGTQTIATGNLSLTAGNLTVSNGASSLTLVSAATTGTVVSTQGILTLSGTQTAGGFIGNEGVVNVVSASGGIVAGIYGDIVASGTLSGTSVVTPIYSNFFLNSATINASTMALFYGTYGSAISVATNTTNCYGILMYNPTAAVIGAFIGCSGDANYFALIGSATTYVATPAGVTPGATNRTLKVSINGADYFILASNSYS